MKILAINASHRGDQGYTRFLVDLLLKGAAAAGAECEVVTLARLKIHRCLGCTRCQGPEHPGECVYASKDDVAQVFAKMAAADLVVYATPVYVFGITGLLKTFLDRFEALGTQKLEVAPSGLLFHEIDRRICSKPFALIVCCDNVEAATPHNVIDYFKTFADFMGAALVGVLARNAGSLLGHGKHPERVALFPKMPAVHAAFEQAGRELATRGSIRRSTRRAASQEVVPVPLFGLLKRLRSRAFKRLFVERAEAMRQADRPGPA